MSGLLPERLALLGRAAELRANGTPWPDVAAQLATGTDELRRLAGEHVRAFGRLQRQARREFLGEVMAGAVARLRELLKSPQEGVALTAAVTLVRYDLAKTRDRRLAHAGRKARHRRRRRDELPPRPGVTVTAEAVEATETTEMVENTRCDSPTPAPQVLMPERVPAAPVAAEKTGCDSVTAAPPAPAPRGSTRQVDAIRRKRWLPPGLAPTR
jgi:hypothetical protein